MVCKNCGAFLSDDLKDCPVCGAIIGEESEGTVENKAFISPDANEDVDAKPKKKKSPMVLITVLLSVLLVLAIGICILLTVDGVSDKVKGFFTDVFSSSDVGKKNKPDDVVAEFMGEKLTNTKLNYYYYDVYETFYSMYGDQLEAVIAYVLNEGETMQDFLVECAINEWANTVALTQKAKKDNFTLSDDVLAEIDSIMQIMTESAISSGYSTADAFIKTLYGDFSTAATYVEHYEETTYAYMYKMDFFNEKYYDYMDDLEGLETYNYSVRHILIAPTDTSSDADWKEAEDEANKLYQEWLDGDATEDSFGALAYEHSADTGSAMYGGLYEDVYDGYMTTTFNDWCMDGRRVHGDTGIVKTEYGYHIMYFVSFVNPNAYDSASSDLSTWINAAKSGATPTTNLDKVTINNIQK
ncbi:MAG: peptidylprolyl isomerase [Clostridia bacterium]|nr:peptidylprolyl isomerase [Clostridia bacterium]